MIEEEQETKIFVSDLPKRAANKSFIVSFFRECGKIDPNGITIYENKYQGNNSSHNFSAFVTFKTKEEAMKAKIKYNFTKIDDVPIQIILSDNETRQIRQSGEGFICINGLDLSIDEIQLEKMLSIYGEIIYMKIERLYTYSIAYIQFRSKENIKRIINDFDGKVINGKELYVRPNKNFDCNSIEFITTCYIQNIPPSMNSDDDLKCLFSPFGKIISSKVVKNRFNNTNRGIGFVTMETEEELLHAISRLNGKIIDGYKIFCRQYMSPSERGKYLDQRYEQKHKETKEKNGKRSVFISNIDKNVNINDIKFIASDFGEIDQIKLYGRSILHGSIVFKRIEDAKRFIESSPFIFINGRQLHAGYKEYDSSLYSELNYNKNTFLQLLHDRNQDTQKVINNANVLSGIQTKYLIDNQNFINQWIELCNMY